VSANWNTIEGGGGSNGVPLPADNAIIRGGITKTVNFDGNYTNPNGVNELRLDSANTATTLTLNQTANSMISNLVNIGVSGRGAYTQSGGTNALSTTSGTAMQIGVNSGSTGTYALSGSGV